jgi:hypothetical protein
MKKLFLLLPVLLIGTALFMGQNLPEKEKWSVDSRMTGIDPADNYSPFIPALPQNHVFSTEPILHETSIGPYLVSPNVRVHPTTNTNQSEVIIVRHPINQNIMWASGNMTTIGGPLFISEGVYVTTNAGISWFGSDTLTGAPINNHGGDPAPTIDKDGNFIMTHLGYTTSGMFGNYSTNNGATWSNTFTIATGSQDKNLSGTDDDPSSPYYGRSYTVWSWFPVSAPWIAVSYTTNGGVSWSPSQQINTPPSGHYSQGADIRIGPGGVVYVTWTAPVSSSPFTGDYVGFAKSTNGGVNWTVTENAFDINGIRSSSFGSYGIRTNDFPRIDVDRSGGPRNGWIYIVVPQKSPGVATDAADVILYKSTNGGVNWSSGTRVNQDTPGNGKLQFFPAVRVDENGGVNVVYYDNRNTAADSAQAYVSRSVDGGTTWVDILVSDHRFRPRAISGLAGGYSGDYIGITSGNNKVWPVWMDNSTGNYQLWTASIQLATYPLNTYNLQTPSGGTTITTYPNSSTQYTFTWDTSASTASYKWIFGNPTPAPRKITLPTGSNSLTLTSGQLDQILEGLGVLPGQSLAGQWDVWAFRNNLPLNDSLKAANGPRNLTLGRGIPPLTAFNLNTPPNNTTITTSVFNSSTVAFNWSRSGQGTTYKVKFGAPTVATPLLTFPASNGGYDSVLTMSNSELDVILNGISLQPGDSLTGQYAVWAYNGLDSLKSTQTFNLTLKRQAKGNVVVLYDSSSVAGRTSRDSVINILNQATETYDLFNRGTQTSTHAISLRGYKKVILLGQGTNVMNTTLKDSIISYLNSGGTTTATKSKLLIYSEDIGYQFGRTASTYYDANFVSRLGWFFVADRPATGANQGLVGDYINNGLRDSTVGFWPDVFRRDSTHGMGSVLYRFRIQINNPDSANAIGLVSNTYIVATFGDDIRSLRNSVNGATGSPVSRFVLGGLQFVDFPVGIEDPVFNTSIPGTYEMSQNYPNPFNPATKINFAIPKQGHVTLKIFDLLGREISVLVNNEMSPGYYTVDFNGSNYASGVYFYRLEAKDGSAGFTQVKKMVLVK